MTPLEFEQLIAGLFEMHGYVTQFTRRSYDYGVDIIASKRKEKIAIQVKMYDSRLVNYKDVMYLHAGKDYYDCNKAILFSLGSFDPMAIKVANKLGVVVQDNFNLQDYHLTKSKSLGKEKDLSATQAEDDFDVIWQRDIMSLKGQIIYTAKGMKNRIIEVTNDHLARKSSTGKTSKIDKQIF